MKYYKRSNLFKASNLQYNPENGQSHSYGWWMFTRIINGKLVFNKYLKAKEL